MRKEMTDFSFLQLLLSFILIPLKRRGRVLLLLLLLLRGRNQRCLASARTEGGEI